MPKDTNRLLANCKDEPRNLIETVVDANRTRTSSPTRYCKWCRTRSTRARKTGRRRVSPDHEVEQRQLPCEFHPGRHETHQGQGRARGGLRPALDALEFFGSEVTHDLAKFKAECDAIVANRWGDDSSDVADKVYARDLFKRTSYRDIVTRSFRMAEISIVIGCFAESLTGSFALPS